MKKYFRTGPKTAPTRYKSHLSITTTPFPVDDEAIALILTNEFDNIKQWIVDERTFNEDFLKRRNIPFEYKVYQYEKNNRKCNATLSKFISDKFPDIAGAKLAGQNIELLIQAEQSHDKDNDIGALKSLYRAAKVSRALVVADMEASFLSEKDRVSKLSNSDYSQKDYDKAMQIMENRGGQTKEWAYIKITKQTGMSRSTAKRAIESEIKKVNDKK